VSIRIPIAPTKAGSSLPCIPSIALTGNWNHHGPTESLHRTRAAHLIVAEVVVDMTRFPSPGHLASWARFAPGVNEPQAARRDVAPPVMATFVVLSRH
jgi:Transposase IS116/IS110/IS902 family